MFKSTVILVILNCIIRTSYCFEFPKNPCPSIFSYVFNGKEWFGYITVPAPQLEANTAEISANFSIEGIINKYGPIKLDEYDKTIDKITKGQPLNYIVTLPKSYYLPTVTQIKYNGKILCAGKPVSALTRSSFWLQHTFNWTGVINPQMYYPIHSHPVTSSPSHVIYFPTKPITYQPPVVSPIYTNPIEVTTKPHVWKPSKFSNYRECGVIRKKRSAEDDYEKRIINGSIIQKNAHPWLAALFDVTHGQRNGVFFCAGSLISNKHVLTAAHCTIVKKPSIIQVRLGVHDTQQLFDPGVQQTMVKMVLEHPDYKSGNAHADMSFLLLENEVNFTPAVKPICLWNLDANVEGIIGNLGTIMGWGKTEDGEISTKPLETAVTITTKQKCQEIDLLKNLVTDQTFCAGTKGTGPCLGDSGGGLFLTLDGKWYLRGIISTSIADRYTQICDTNSFSIYVDTAKYMDWIVNNMEYN